MQRAGSGIGGLGESYTPPHHFNLPKTTREQIDRRLKLIRQREFEMKRKENALIEAERQLQQRQLEMIRKTTRT